MERPLSDPRCTLATTLPLSPSRWRRLLQQTSGPPPPGSHTCTRPHTLVRIKYKNGTYLDTHLTHCLNSHGQIYTRDPLFYMFTTLTFQLNRVTCVKSVHARMGTTYSRFSFKLNFNLTSEVCVCACVFILWVTACLQSDTVFRKPSLRPVELSQPPVFLLLQHANEVTLWEAEKRSDDVTGTGGEVGASFRGGWPWGDGSRHPERRGLRRAIRSSAGFLNGANQLWNQVNHKISLGERNKLQMLDLLTLILSTGRWRPVNVWVDDREAERERNSQQREAINMQLYRCSRCVSAAVCVCVCVPQQDLVPKLVYSSLHR